MQFNGFIIECDNAVQPIAVRQDNFRPETNLGEIMASANTGHEVS